MMVLEVLNIMPGFTRSDLQIWVINLDRSPERMERMSNGLQQLGLRYIRFSAIDGENLPPAILSQVDKKAYERNMGQLLVPGKVGCYYSHLSLWKELAASDAPVGLILEDDVVFHDDFVEALDAALASADYWDLLRLNATRAKFPVSRGQTQRWKINGYVGRFTGNGAYLIKADEAERIAKRISIMRWSFEYEIGRFYYHNYRLAGLEPFPTHIEDYGESQIFGKNDEKLVKLRPLKRLPYLVIKMLNYFLRWIYFSVGRSWPKLGPINQK